MKVSPSHILSHGPVIATLLKTASTALTSRMGNHRSTVINTPGRTYRDTIQPLNQDLVRDYVRHVEGDTSWYRGLLPPHLFPQWGFPLLAKTLQRLPYDLTRILNGGCRIEMSHPIPSDKPLLLRANLMELDDNGSRVKTRQRLVTGTTDNASALTSYITAVIPLKSSGNDRKKERPRVPEESREIDRWRLRGNCGLEFAMLTGDFNPVHWIGPYARLFGFRNSILHGFSAMARSIESINRTILSGQTERLGTFDVRFVKPLTLPADVGVYINDDGGVFIGMARGATAFLSGNYTLK